MELESNADAYKEQQTKVEQLTKSMSEQSDQLQKYQREIDRLLDILKEMELEKHNKDEQIRELHE